jgi:hypothetical protein
MNKRGGGSYQSFDSPLVVGESLGPKRRRSHDSSMTNGDGERDERKRKSVAEGDNNVTGRHGRVATTGRKRDSHIVYRPDKATRSPSPPASAEISGNERDTRKHTAGKKGNIFSCVKKIKGLECF